MLAMEAADATVWVALIGFPPTLIAALAGWRNAKKANHAVNSRVTSTTISEDIADLKVQMHDLSRDIIWLTHQFSRHLKEHVNEQKGE